MPHVVRQRLDSLPVELREIIWQLLGELQNFYFDFDLGAKEVYIKADNLVAWGEWVIDELYTVDWDNLRAVGFDFTAKVEVRWEEWYGQVSHYSDVPEWALGDVLDALLDNGFRAIDFVNCETGEVRRRVF